MNVKHLGWSAALMMAFTSSTSWAANEVRFGEWVSGSHQDNSYFVAATSNESGNTITLACYVEIETCFWILITGHTCEVDSRYVALVNAASTAKSVELACIELEGAKMMVFQDFDAIESVIRGIGRIGIAFPMKDGAFVVMRFKLDGSGAAIDHAKDRAARHSKASTHDQRL